MKVLHAPLKPWQRALPFWCVLLGGFGLSLVAFYLAYQKEVDRAELEFKRRAELYHATIEASLNQRLESLHSLQSLMEIFPRTTRGEFRRWAAEIVQQHPEVQVLEWAPRIRREDRAGLEAVAWADGLTGYQLRQRGTNGRPEAVQDRPEYCPIFYTEPQSGNEVIHGLDVLVGITRRESELARDNNQPVLSGRITMDQRPGDQPGLILILPVYREGATLATVEQRREAFTGFIRGVFRLGDLLGVAWGDASKPGLEMLILDNAASTPETRLLYFHGEKGASFASVVPPENAFRGRRNHFTSLTIGSRTWTLSFSPTQRWWSSQMSWLPYVVFAGGLGVALLAGAYVRSAFRRAEMIERTVTERTVELSREIGERRRAEDELRKTQTTLVMAQRIGRVGSWEMEIATGELTWSEETFRIFGRDPAVFKPSRQAFLAAIYPYDRLRVEKAARISMLSGARYDVEHRILRPDGTECFVHELAEVVRDENGQPARMIGTVQDITERHSAEERLEWERNLLRAVIDNVPDYIFFKDSEGRFMLSNLAHQRVLGVKSMEELAGKTIADLMPAEIAMLHAAGDEQVFKTGQAIINREEPLLTREGERRILLTTKIPIKDARGLVTGVVGLCRDITDRKREEEERKVMERKFQETQKLESLGVLAGGIAHDFNNLLTGILGNASLIRMELPAESALHTHLEQIELSSQRAADLCKQMLAYSGKGRFIIQRIDLTALVNETLHLLHLSISKRAALRLHLAEQLPTIMADATQIRQIIMNLMINASDAIGDKNGLITISTGCIEADAKYLAELVGGTELAPGKYVWLEISDNGCGMSPETKAKIFEPFFTTKFTGRGLGLAAVLGIVRGHKGALKVYSELGKGSTFKLLLPGAGVPAGAASTPIRSTVPLKAEGTVLVIDDEESVRKVAEGMLKSFGFQVVTANDGEQGLRLYRENPEAFTAVLLDLTMPRLDGEETFREIRRIRSEARVVLMSGFNEQEAAARFVGKGLAGFVQKPFSPADLRQKLVKASRDGQVAIG